MITEYRIKIKDKTIELNEAEYYTFINQFNAGTPQRVNDLQFIKKLEDLIKVTSDEIEENKNELIRIMSKKDTLIKILNMIK